MLLVFDLCAMISQVDGVTINKLMEKLMVSKDRKVRKRGPKPERVKIDEGWEDAVKTALEKKRPKDGWPKDDDAKDDDETSEDSEK